MEKCTKGYFEFDTRQDGLYLTVYPPQQGEPALDAGEVLYYIEKKNIYGCDIALIGDTVKKGATQEVTVKVSDETPYPVSEFGDYRISHDTMTLEAVFYPPFKGAEELTYEEIQKDLKNIGVISGISEEAIRLFLLEKRYFEIYVLAKGTKAREGSDGYIEYTFNTSLKPTPKMNEDGTVDYTQDFFGKETSLTVSGQLNGETYAQAFRSIYTFGPTFRAENSNTTRHAAEFWMIEPEIAFADLEDDMELAEAMLKYVINYVLENAPEEMNFFNSFVDKGLLDRLHNVVNSDFARVTYTEAIEILEKNNDKFDYKVSWGCDLQTEHERYLTEEIYKKPVFVTDYPKEIKAFYMKLNGDGKTVAAVDCLVPGIGEIIGGSQREDDYEKLLARMQELGLKEEDYGFYLDLRKYGSTRHAGFGLGFERCVMYLTGISNIRDAIPFPRTVNNCEL